MNQAHQRAAQAARNSYTKLLAILAKRTGDLAGAEDALGDAMIKALTLWPEAGVPQNPEAWLLTAARNRLTDVQRRAFKFEVGEEEAPELIAPDLSTMEHDPRLDLLLVCAHPAIAEDIHAPLMLQTVLGLEAREIALAFNMPAATMAQRLVRAKSKIKSARIPFAVPGPEHLPERLSSLLEAIYAIHALDWVDPRDDRGQEALYLADMVSRILPEAGEAAALATLIAYSHARLPARLKDGVLIGLDEQEMDLWDLSLIQYGNQKFGQVRAQQREGEVPGRFALEAAIAQVHMDRQRTGKTNWAALSQLYQGMLQLYPTLGAQIAFAAVMGQVQGPEVGLQILDALTVMNVEGFQAYHATRAELLAKSGHAGPARQAYTRASELSTDAATRAYLDLKIKELG